MWQLHIKAITQEYAIDPEMSRGSYDRARCAVKRTNSHVARVRGRAGELRRPRKEMGIWPRGEVARRVIWNEERATEDDDDSLRHGVDRKEALQMRKVRPRKVRSSKAQVKHG